MKVPPDTIHQLWDELSAYPVTETDAACNHLMQTVAGWIDGDRPGWIGVVRLLSGRQALRDPMAGWRQGALHFLEPFTPKEQALALEALTKSPDWGMTSCALAARHGTFRSHRMRDGFIDFAAFCKTEHYRRFYTGIGVCDRIWVGVPVTEDAESFFIFDRRDRAKRFTAAELEVAAYAMRGLMWFHRRLLVEHGLGIVQKPLTPQERRTLQHLLSGKSVKQVADAMNQSPHTTGGHIKELFRKYGVNSRSELMAIWLNRV